MGDPKRGSCDFGASPATPARPEAWQWHFWSHGRPEAWQLRFWRFACYTRATRSVAVALLEPWETRSVAVAILELRLLHPRDPKRGSGTFGAMGDPKRGSCDFGASPATPARPEAWQWHFW